MRRALGVIAPLVVGVIVLPPLYDRVVGEPPPSLPLHEAERAARQRPIRSRYVALGPKRGFMSAIRGFGAMGRSGEAAGATLGFRPAADRGSYGRVGELGTDSNDPELQAPFTLREVVARARSGGRSAPLGIGAPESSRKRESK